MWEWLAGIGGLVLLVGAFWGLSRLLRKAQAGDRAYGSGNDGVNRDAFYGAGHTDLPGGGGPGPA
jgi:hypothetical protein